MTSLLTRRLRTTDDSVGKIARSVGYTCEYAFSPDILTRVGSRPGRFRQRASSWPHAAQGTLIR